jgi:hypothetical protein
LSETDTGVRHHFAQPRHRGFDGVPHWRRGARRRRRAPPRRRRPRARSRSGAAPVRRIESEFREPVLASTIQTRVFRARHPSPRR